MQTIRTITEEHMMAANDRFMWGFLVHLGYNLYNEPALFDGVPSFPGRKGAQLASDTLLCQKDVWTETLDNMRGTGCNTVVIDLCEGVRYESHPEIAVKGAWSKQELRDEIARLRSLGYEVIPKLNFSAAHDQWMGVYSRMVSTPAYYQFCTDVLDEVCELFDNPRLFHLGMDEECLSVQEFMNYCVIRNGELYWHDFFRLVRCVESHGCRPWIWADYVWHDGTRCKSFLQHMTKDVLCSNWYYHLFRETAGWLKNAYDAYEVLDRNGFDQVPTAMSCAYEQNFDLTVGHCTERLSPDLLKGYLLTTWAPMTEENKAVQLRAADIMKTVHDKYQSGGYRK